jgi:hypothetical protein
MKEKKELVAKTLIDELKQEEFEFTDDKGNPLIINEKGSLGLLAVGYKGLVALRNIRIRNNYSSTNSFVSAEKQKK